MKKLFNALGTIAILAVLIFSFAACDDLFGNKDSTEYEPKVYHCSIADGTDYTLTITRTDKAAVQFNPAAGDSYVLTITKWGDTKKSSGKVKSYSNEKFTLTPSSNASATFDVTVSGELITKIESSTETIPVDGGGTVKAPGPLTPVNAFVPVTGITGVPASVPKGTITLTGTVVPADATNKAPIVWSLKSGTGAAISGDVLTTTAEGTVTVTATIINGLTASTPYTQDINIEVIKTFTDILAFNTWYNTQLSPNTTANATNVALSVVGSDYLNLSINQEGKYVSLDLSGSTFKSIDFSGCTGLTGVTIPKSVTYIYPGAFSGCAYLSAINVASGNSKYTSDSDVLYDKYKTTLVCYPGGKTGSFTIPDGVDTIERKAFYESKLTSVTIPNSVTYIGSEAFYKSKLTSVTIPNSVTNIGSEAFSGCASLTAINVASGNSEYISDSGVLYDKDINTLVCYPGGKAGPFVIPDSVKYIYQDSFNGCIGLTIVTIHKNVTYIEDRAFSGCANLSAINVASDNSSYSSDDGVLYDKYKTTLKCYPGGKTGSFTIPDDVYYIGSEAFSGCTKLTSVIIPDSVHMIYSNAFSGCTGLESVTIGNSVASIEREAFSGCTKLTSITIPVSVTSIGEEAFLDTSLINVKFDGGSINLPNPYWSTRAFPGSLDEQYRINGIGTYKRTDVNTYTWNFVG